MKTNKNNWRKRKNQVEVLEVLKPNNQKVTTKDAIPKNALTEEAKNELIEIKKIYKKR